MLNFLYQEPICFPSFSSFEKHLQNRTYLTNLPHCNLCNLKFQQFVVLAAFQNLLFPLNEDFFFFVLGGWKDTSRIKHFLPFCFPIAQIFLFDICYLPKGTPFSFQCVAKRVAMQFFYFFNPFC